MSDQAKPMKAYAYRLASRKDTFLLVPREADFSRVPDELRIGEVSRYKVVDLSQPVPFVGADQKQIANDITSQGYSLQTVVIDAEWTTADGKPL